MRTSQIDNAVAIMNNDFKEWMRVAGYNGRQVSEAGASIGMSQSLSINTSRGARELTETERLAMAAKLAGLPAWTPESSDAIIARGRAADEVVALAERIVGQPAPNAQKIPAE